MVHGNAICNLDRRHVKRLEYHPRNKQTTGSAQRSAGRERDTMRRRLMMLLAMLAAKLTTVSSASTLAAVQQNRRPNILLIIMDDVGMDVTTDMYPGLIDDLTKKYGPAGLNHPGYKSINGSPAST